MPAQMFGGEGVQQTDFQNADLSAHCAVVHETFFAGAEGGAHHNDDAFSLGMPHIQNGYTDGP